LETLIGRRREADTSRLGERSAPAAAPGRRQCLCSDVVGGEVARPAGAPYHRRMSHLHPSFAAMLGGLVATFIGCGVAIYTAMRRPRA